MILEKEQEIKKRTKQLGGYSIRRKGSHKRNRLKNNPFLNLPQNLGENHGKDHPNKENLW